jgi:hypothetical protein
MQKRPAMIETHPVVQTRPASVEKPKVFVPEIKPFTVIPDQQKA